MKTYRVMVGSGKREAFRFRGNMAQASAPIVLIRDGHEEATPFQTANAHHRVSEAATLLSAWADEPLGAGWYVGEAEA